MLARDKHTNLLQNRIISTVKSFRPVANPIKNYLKGVILRWAPALPANIRLGWKGLPGTNTLA
jgi:hypothetical protein